jgi:Mg-chelatase subunit ChlI
LSATQVELPLGATEDRICGTIDIEKALTEGVKAFEPGLLVRGVVCACVRACVCAC